MAEEFQAKVPVRRRPNYFLVLIFLVVFTGIEIGVSYINGGIKVPLLITLAGIKAALVILYFMHLKFDSRVFAWWFILGAILITPLLIYLGLLMPGK